jgi:hypothetical protein
MAQIQVIPKIMGWSPFGVINTNLIEPLHRSGGRTYNIPNYATRFVFCVAVSSCPGFEKERPSYANEKSSVISVSFDEDKGTPKTIITIFVIFLLFTAMFLVVPKSVERSTPTTTTNLHDWSKQQIDLVRGVNPSQLDSS